MDRETLEKKVQKRAHEIAREKIGTFRQQVYAALRQLAIEPFSSEATQCFTVLASTDTTKGWPVAIFEREEQRLMQEILSTMDAMQKMLVAKSSDLPVGEVAPDA